MFLVFVTFGTLDFRAVMAAAAEMPIDWAWGGALTLIGLLLFVGAAGKSAQLPLFVWLPDAMEGPTPVSALIHAATMVTAGVYMVARSAPIYAHAPNAMATVAIVGAATAIFAATIGLVQNDIKRVLAYSTVSQLGYMFLACGVGAFGAGIFHVFTHAFFKALLFLGSGSVIHAMSGEQDMRNMGGLKSKLPWTHLTMLVGCIAIAGIPPLAGFFSKDEILWSAYRVGGYGQYVWGVGAVAAALTAFYMFRLYWMTFGGSFRGTAEQAKHVHESPKTMIVPLQILAVGSILAGFLGVPAVLGGGNFIEHFLEPAFEHAHHALGEVFAAPVPGHGVELGLMGLSVLIAVGGILVATRFYKGAFEIPNRLAASFPGAYRTLLNKYWVDELYGAAVRPGPRAGRRERPARERPLRGGRRRRRGAAGARRQRPGLGRARRAGQGLEPLGPLGRGRRRQPHRLRARQPQLRAAGRAERPRPELRAQHADRPLPADRGRPLPPRAVLRGIRASWTSTGSTSSPSSPTRPSWARSSSSCPRSPGRGRRTRCAGRRTASPSSASC